jgi:ATP-dependent RNA/DNA helicase IGHMBP2
MTHPDKLAGYIDHWLHCLELERKYQQESYRLLMAQKPIKERVKEGFTWFPVRLIQLGFAIGEIPYIEIECKGELVKGDHFQAGRPVQIFPTESDLGDRPVRGIIHWLHQRQMRVYLHYDDFPDWVRGGRFGVDLLYDEQTFRDMALAMKQVKALKPDHPSFHLAYLFYDSELHPESNRPPTQSFHSKSLNPSQNEAVNAALFAQDVSIIHGPPGTGKTTTLIQLIKKLVLEGEQILVCAPSNAAVDWITYLLAEQKVSVIRMGHISRIDRNVLDNTLESLVYSQSDAKEIKKLRIKADEYRKLANQYKRNFGPAERAQRRRLQKEARELSDWAKELEDRLIRSVIQQAKVITCTLTGVQNPYIKQIRFKTCIIDEAAQALQGACWMAILKADRIVLAGDPFQLPPTVKNVVAAQNGLSETLLDIAIRKFQSVNLLNVQYRMNKDIMQFSNNWFYRGKLTPHESVVEHSLQGIDGKEQIVDFIDTAGCGFYEVQEQESLSYFNREEYQLIREHMDPLLARNFLQVPSVGILSPYKAQVKYIKEQFEEEENYASQVTIQTIDGFQGQERDVIYISLVRSNDNQEIGFLKDYRRMNVAMTRARKKLVIIGDSATLGADPFYKSMLEYFDQIGAYRSAWEFIQS